MNKTTFNDDGSAINSYIWTKEFSGAPGHEGYTKDFRFCDLLFEKSGVYDMELRYRADSDRGDGNQKQIDLDPGGTTWNNFMWGTGQWDAGVDAAEESLSLGVLRGKRVQFKISNNNTVNQKFKLYGLNFTYNLKGRR
jgi:hypothetical protein